MDLTKTLNKNVNLDIFNILSNPTKNIPSLEDAIKISLKYNISLHPDFLFYWQEFTTSNFILFLEKLLKIKIKIEKNEIKFIYFSLDSTKRFFEILAIEHKIEKVSLDKAKSESLTKIIILNKLSAKMLFANLNIDFLNIKNLENYKKRILFLIKFAKDNLQKTPIEILNQKVKYEIRDKGGIYIGARMGRPEKAKLRKQFNSETKSHGLFPLGEQSGKLKNIIEVLNSKGFVTSEFRLYECTKCSKINIYQICDSCNSKCEQLFFERYSKIQVLEKKEDTVYYKKYKYDLNDLIYKLRKILGKENIFPKNVKGIKETINKHHTTEHISKAFLRAKHNLYVNKDGTIRYDMIEMGITHFKPKEIETSILKLKELGYTTDYLGKVITDDNQIIEIYPQDVILPNCRESDDELAVDFVINTGNFIDELLVKLYKLKPFYNFKTQEDTLGHLIIGLAPHTSAGIIGRIIGYSKTQGCFSHPVWHAAQRRNLDGDENGVLLLLDGLINFSRDYLPNRRGSRTMDVSLVLTSHLYLDQIDDEVHGMDVEPFYDLNFYNSAKNYKSAKSLKMQTIGSKIKKKNYDKSYLGAKFTHGIENLNDTVLYSSYKKLPSMNEKLEHQLKLAEKLRCVDENKVASFIIDKHFMKDIKGNLRKFSMQNFRCTKCNAIFRRPPLLGKCPKCLEIAINFTISEGSIKKYLQPSFNIIKNYDVEPYIVETLELTDLRIKGVFGEQKEKQKNLQNFFKK